MGNPRAAIAPPTLPRSNCQNGPGTGRVPAPPAASWPPRPPGPGDPPELWAAPTPPKPRADSGKPAASSPQAVQVKPGRAIDPHSPSRD
eukprot:gene7510-biopygen10585